MQALTQITGPRIGVPQDKRPEQWEATRAAIARNRDRPNESPGVKPLIGEIDWVILPHGSGYSSANFIEQYFHISDESGIKFLPSVKQRWSSGRSIPVAACRR